MPQTAKTLLFQAGRRQRQQIPEDTFFPDRIDTLRQETVLPVEISSLWKSHHRGFYYAFFLM